MGNGLYFATKESLEETVASMQSKKIDVSIDDSVQLSNGWYYLKY